MCELFKYVTKMIVPKHIFNKARFSWFFRSNVFSKFLKNDESVKCIQKDIAKVGLLEFKLY